MVSARLHVFLIIMTVPSSLRYIRDDEANLTARDEAWVIFLTKYLKYLN